MSLERARRLGHGVDGVQRYFRPDDLSKGGNVPATARVSENLNIVWEAPQTVYASDGHIRQANQVLSRGSRIVLAEGEEKEFDLEMESDDPEDDLVTIDLGDFRKVVPRYNPEVEGGNETAREASPEATDDPIAVERKHVAYEKRLADLGEDYALFLEEVEAGRKDPELGAEGGVATTDPNDWYQAASTWVSANETRRLVLKLQVQEIAAAFLLGGDVARRKRSLAALGDALAIFIRRELSQPDRIALPTDCAQVVQDIATDGVTREEDTLADNPEIGGNYYTALPKNAANVGWNFHWAGVILKDGGDNVTLESAGGTSVTSVGKSSWWMEMYGTKQVDQTFKKRIHQLHLERNRQMIERSEDPENRDEALGHLREHGRTVAGWTDLDSDT